MIQAHAAHSLTLFRQRIMIRISGGVYQPLLVQLVNRLPKHQSNLLAPT